METAIVSITGKKSLEQYAYEQIKTAIYTRKLSPGSALTEKSLCDSLKVSRSPVRNALRKLADEGLVTIFPNRGAFITQLDQNEIRQLYEIRVELEAFACRIGIKNITSSDIEALYKLIEEEKSAFTERNFREYLEINGKFHELIVSKANNKYLTELFMQTYRKLMIVLVLYDNFYVEKGDEIHSIHYNIEIVNAIKNQDANLIYELVKELAEITVDNLAYVSLPISDVLAEL